MAAPRSGPRRTPVRDTRGDIFAAAADLFSARGFDGVGVDDIAHAARLNTEVEKIIARLLVVP